ncbi:glycine cleavage system protein R [Vibrio viridaestus]|uniref:Glycine cleavage system transcriptional repressor n=1 Tax=Vibrio viridaestus TaxID=2487322 RepID=A0A3N9TGQ5_9VIBR|nr:ACT domain-containing protein [Vibrio viridaestus]RQW63461.1 transcriptional regulator [Vibrio viridaestus]
MTLETFIVGFTGIATPKDIKRFAAITHDNGGKWLISKINYIDENVAGLIKVQAPSESSQLIKDGFRSHEGITVEFTSGEENDNKHQDVYHLRFDATDRFGIVNEITHLLDNQRIRVIDMNCQRIFISGVDGINTNLFSANLTIKLPNNMPIKDVVNELESLSEDTRVIIES